MLINSVESLVRDGYQIHVTTSGEVYVYFTTDSQPRQHEVWNRDNALIDAFLGGRYISDYCYMSIRPVAAFSSEPVAEPAPVPTPKPTASKSAHKPVSKPVVAESVAEPVVNSTSVVPDNLTPATSAFKPSLTYCGTPPAQSPDFLEVLGGADNEYVVYAKACGDFHIHWSITRQEAKEVWRRDRESIRHWLGADTLNSVSWEEPSAKADKAPKWKEISAEQTKVRTVVRQLVAFGKPVADLAILEDGSHHVYFYLPRQEAGQIYPNIKAEFAGYEITSVSFEERLTRHQEWVEQFHCVDPIDTEHDSIAISDKELYRFLTQRIDGNSLIQDDSTFYHNGYCWTFKDSDLSLSTLAQLAFRVPSFSLEAKHNASRIAHTVLNGKTVILTE